MLKQGQTYPTNCQECRAYQKDHCTGSQGATAKYDGQMSKIYEIPQHLPIFESYQDQHQYTCQVTGMTKVHETKEIKRFLITEEIADLV